jgi:hypothetical protein
LIQLIFAAILGGLVVVIVTRFGPKKSILKLFLKMLLFIRDYLLSVLVESYEKFKDILAESKAEYEVEKRAERKVTSDDDSE